MSFWKRLQELIEEARRRTLGVVLEALAAHKARRDEADFSIALIALSAKMARADGFVTDTEIAAFRNFFSFPEDQADKVRMVFSLAQQDVAGFDLYLARVARIYEDQPQILEDVFDCLLYVASADGAEHPRERDLLDRAAEVFKLTPQSVRRLRAVHFGLEADDPWSILGVPPEADAAALKTAYRSLVRAHHPDALIARGVPPALVRIGEARMAAINAAYERALALATA